MTKITSPNQIDFPQASSANKTRQPIGIFDSGVGGLSVWREIKAQLPAESILYFADQAHVPYGNRTLDEIRGYATGITRFLIAQGAKIIVVACNTASGAALADLRTRFSNIHFVGMEPAIKPAIESTKTGHVGVIATPTTFQAPLYKQLVYRFGGNVMIHTQTCPGLVEQIEAGYVTGQKTAALLKTCLEPLNQYKIDQLVLGCTHYPFIKHLAQQILGNHVNIIDPAPAVARQTGRVLLQDNLLNTQHSLRHEVFFTSENTDPLMSIAHKLVGYTGPVCRTNWDGRTLTIPSPSECQRC